MMKIACLVIGLLVGALAGYLTRPEAAELRVGNLSVEVQSGGTASARSGGGLTTGQTQHVGAFAAGGAVIGLLAGFVLDRRRA